MNREPAWDWVARLARALGGFFGAVLLGMLLVTYPPIDLITPGTVPQGLARTLIAAGVGLVIGGPLAFGIVLALGWNESRSTWPLAGFILGSEVVSGLLLVAIRIDGAGAPSRPDLAWWAACTSGLVLGAFAAFGVIQRRGRIARS